MEKGTFGYIDSYKKRYGFYSAILAVLILAGAGIVFLIFGTMKHVAILIPVILALPFAKMLVQWVIVAKFHSLKKEEEEKLQDRLGERKNCILVYDTALSSHEAISYASVLVIDQGNIHLLWGGSNEKSYGPEQQRDYVQDIIQRTGYSYSAYTAESLEELMEQVEERTISEEDLSVKCDRLRQRMLDVCV